MMYGALRTMLIPVLGKTSPPPLSRPAGEGKLPLDAGHNAVRGTAHLPIPEPQNAVAVLLQPRCACRVEGGLISTCVHLAIQFDSQAHFEATEVDNERADRHLATELRAKLVVAKALPKDTLLRGWLASELAGARFDGLWTSRFSSERH
jgi:hypothetical protein